MIKYIECNNKKINFLLSVLFIIPIFFDIKLNFQVSFFYLKTSYFFLSLILLIYLLNFNFFSKKYIFFFYLIIFLFLNFILNFNQINTGLFLKQLLAILLLSFIFFNLFNSNLLNLDYFYKIYLILSLISIYTGFFVFLFYLIFKLDFSLFFSLKNLSTTIFYYFYENENTFRFDGFSSEPATLGIALLPSILILLYNSNISKIHLLPIIIAILATQSIYAFLGLILIFLLIMVKKRKFVMIFPFLFLIIFITYQSQSIKAKIIETFLHSKSIFNIGWDQKKFETNLLLNLKKFNYETFEQYTKLYLTKEEDYIRINLLNKIFENNKANMNSKIKESDKRIILEYNIYPTYQQFNASTCAYLYNGFVTVQSLNQNLLTGVGLGNYSIVYNQYSNNWKFKNSNYQSCYLLNAHDAKTLFFRLITEFGIIFYSIFMISIIYFYIKTFLSKDHISHCFFICFLLKILQLGSYTDFSIYFFLTIAIKLYNLKENV
jgi:hypothetical protein